MNPDDVVASIFRAARLCMYGAAGFFLTFVGLFIWLVFS